MMIVKITMTHDDLELYHMTQPETVTVEYHIILNYSHVYSYALDLLTDWLKDKSNSIKITMVEAVVKYGMFNKTSFLSQSIVTTQ